MISKTDGISYPLVSVIIRSMDRATLQEALDSVGAQTYPNIEVVLVNAKGAEHRQVGERCGRFPIRMVGFDEKLHRSRAANAGLDSARGDYLIFLDDDDWFAPTHIAALVARLNQEKTARAAYAGVRVVTSNVDATSVEFNTPFSAIRLMGENYIPIHAVLFEKSLLQDGCYFDETLDTNEDWDFWLQVSRLTPFAHLGEISAFYRAGGESGIGPLGEDETAKRQTKVRVFEKWKNLWSASELNALTQMLLDESYRHQCFSAEAKKEIEVQEEDRSRLRLQLADLQERNRHLESHNQHLAHQLEGVIGSKSWKVTAPLRGLGKYARRAVFFFARVYKFGRRRIGRLVKRFQFIAANARPAQEYRTWTKRFSQLDESSRLACRQEIDRFSLRPLISVVMPTYNPPREFLRCAIESVRGQLYPDWELCVADDASNQPHVREMLEAYSRDDSRIRLVIRKENGHISAASNSALEIAQGAFVVLLDHDDELTEDALYWVARTINENPQADIIYSDEDKIDGGGKLSLPFFKPDWSPDLLRAQMYVGHLCALRRESMVAAGGFREGFEGSQDYDLILRLSEQARDIRHIPRVLYHWRMAETSTAIDSGTKPYAHDSAMKALQGHLDRVFGAGQATAREGAYAFTYDVRFRLPDPRPLVSIIIPTKDKMDILARCLDSILEKTDYPSFEILVLDNNSAEAASLHYLEAIPQRDSRIRVLPAHFPFNWSRLNNVGVSQAEGEVLVFLNNDTEVISPDWLERLAENTLRPDIGTVGALLLYEDGTIQHAGVVVGMNGWADHVYKGMKPEHRWSPFISPMLPRNVLASTGACLAISRTRFAELGGFDESFEICGSDVELSLRAYKGGYRNIYTPQVKLYHLESKTRDSYIPENDFTQSALKYSPFRESGDPYYNPNLSSLNAVPSLRA